MYTEAEARKLWCPMVRMPSEDGAGFSGTWSRFWKFLSGPNPAERNANPRECRCIASECAMWRWSHAFPDNDSAPPELRDDYAEQRGFCGLGGKP